MKISTLPLTVLSLALLASWRSADASAVELSKENIEGILEHNELVFLNFYADWCRFSQMLKPIYDDAAQKIAAIYPQQGKVVFAKVNCDVQSEICQKYFVNKYPTLKLVRSGELVKKEYRGQRSAEALVNFIQGELKTTFDEIKTMADLDELDEEKRHIIGYFDQAGGAAHDNFAKVASLMRDDCKFHAVYGEASLPERSTGDNVVYRAPKTQHQDVRFTGLVHNYELFHRWAYDNCVPVVRHITFENAEELTEEGLPFIILFHKPEDTEILDIYTKKVQAELMPEKSSINFLNADGMKFSHPLHHLGKSTNDLPILAIDSFRHMYIFPHDTKTGLETPGLVKQFIADLHSGKLHREFHHGPDPATTPVPQVGEEVEATKNIPNDPDKSDEEVEVKKPTAPPESTFKKLAPSSNRYTLLKDEL